MKIRHIYISPGHNYFGHHGGPAGEHSIVEVSEAECVAGRGIKGDRFFDFKENYKGQITFFSAEVFDDICRLTGAVGKSSAVTRRNVITAGVDLNSLIGQKFELQGISFEGVCECKPCYWMDQAIGPGAEAGLQGRGGLRARILTDGWLRVDTDFSAVILAGGKSSRMGRDKAFLELDGQTLLVRQIKLARDAGATEVFISGRPDTDYPAMGCRVLSDHFREAGPLAGIERALQAMNTPLLLVLAVDLAGMEVTWLHRVLATRSGQIGVVPRLHGQIEPLAAFYPKTAQGLAFSRLQAGDNSTGAFAESCAQAQLLQFLDLPEKDARFFANWNSPADLP